MGKVDSNSDSLDKIEKSISLALKNAFSLIHVSFRYSSLV